jgi:hypothetical protein
MSHQQQQQSTPASNAVFDSLKQSRRNSQVQQYNYQLNEFTPQQVPSVPVTPATIPHTGAANMMTTPINTNPITVRHNSFTTNATSSNNNDANSVASRSTQNTNYNHHHHQQQNINKVLNNNKPFLPLIPSNNRSNNSNNSSNFTLIMCAPCPPLTAVLIIIRWLVVNPTVIITIILTVEKAVKIINMAIIISRSWKLVLFPMSMKRYAVLLLIHFSFVFI